MAASALGSLRRDALGLNDVDDAGPMLQLARGDQGLGRDAILPARSPMTDPSSQEDGGIAAVVASPLATGDFGGRFQDLVGGWFLAKLLTREPVTERSGIPVRVGFQRALHGADLDDVVLETESGLSIEFSIKAGIAIQASDRELRETLSRAWSGSGNNDTSWYGLIAQPAATGIGDLSMLVFYANEHDEVDEFMRSTTTPGTVSEERLRRYSACRTILAEAKGSPLTDLEFHAFLRRFVVLTLDFAIPDHGASESIITTLTNARGITRDQARALLSHLVTIDERAAIGSVAYGRRQLVERLRIDGVPAGITAEFGPDVRALDAYAQRTFESRRNTVAGVQLERGQTTEAILTAVANGNTALLGGPSGYGKSAVLRDVYARLVTDGPVLHLSGRRVETAGSWTVLADDIGIVHDRARLTEVCETHIRGATVILDALEHVQTAGARDVVNDLLRDLRARCGSLNVVLATRDLLVADVLGWLDVSVLNSLERVTLDTLTAEDAARIAQAAPALGPLVAGVSRKRIPGGLVAIDLLHDARVPAESLAGAPATEADLLEIWWNHIVVGGGEDRYARRAAARAAAEAVVRAAGALFQLPGALDGQAIGSLEVDGVLVLDEPLDAFRFGHDIIQDWAIVRWLDSTGVDADAEMRELARIPGFYRSVALFAQRLAEREPDRYDAFLNRIEEAGDSRGVQAFLSALALSPHARALLDARTEMLLANGAARLSTLLNILRTEQVDINVNAVDTAREHGMTVETAVLGGLTYGAPRYATWAAPLQFCVQHLDRLASATLPFVQMADRWQQTTPIGAPLRADLFTATMRILAQIEHWHERDAHPLQIRYDDRGHIGTAARSAVAFAADVDPVAVSSYLDDLRDNGYSDAQEEMLGHAGAIGRVLTEEVVEYVFALLRERERQPWEMSFSELGLTPHRFYPASDLQGPFLALLRSNEAAGLAVVRRLAALALSSYERGLESAQYSRNAVHLRPLTFEFRGRTITMRGDERVYTWFRPGPSDDSTVLTSALMALDTWAIESIKNGRDPIDIVDSLISDTECVSLLGIAVALAYDDDRVSVALADALAQPWLWRVEFARGQRDAMPNDALALLPAEFRVPSTRPDLVARNRTRDAERAGGRRPMRLAALLLFLSGATVRQSFIDRTSQAQLPDACLFNEEYTRAEQSPEAQEDFELFRAFVDPDNYEQSERQIEFRQPENFRRRAEAQRANRDQASLMLAGLLAANALRDYEAPSRIPIAAFEPMGLQFVEGLSNGRFVGDDERSARNDVVRCAAVTVTFGPQASLPPSAWATSIVRDAANVQASVQWSPEVEDGNALDERIGIATALGAMLASNPHDIELRSIAFRAAAHGPMNVGASLLRGLSPAWATRPRLALNVLFLLLEAALRDGSGGVSDDLVAVYERAENDAALGPIPDTRTCSTVAMYRLDRVLPALPDTFADREILDVLVTIALRLLEAARGEETEENRSFRFAFGWRVGRLVGDIYVSLPTDGFVEFRASVTNWAVSLDIFRETVLGVIRGHIARYEISEVSINRFMMLAESFLNSDHSEQLSRQHLSSDFQNACWSLMFCDSLQGVTLIANWPHASRFVEHINKWVRAVGGHPSNASALIAFLDRFAPRFTTAQVIDWIALSAAQTAVRNRLEFWRRNGEAAGLLLLRLRNERPDDFSSLPLRTVASGICDSLVVAGVAIAGEARRVLETRPLRD